MFVRTYRGSLVLLLLLTVLFQICVELDCFSMVCVIVILFSLCSLIEGI